MPAGPPHSCAAFARSISAFPINCIILGWVNLAMMKILQVTLGLDSTHALWALLGVAGVHGVLHGDRRPLGRTP